MLMKPRIKVRMLFKVIEVTMKMQAKKNQLNPKKRKWYPQTLIGMTMLDRKIQLIHLTLKKRKRLVEILLSPTHCITNLEI